MIGLITCGKKKLQHTSPAGELYVGSYFTALKTWISTNCTRWFILSAKYGLIKPSLQIEPYDKTLKRMSKPERMTWAENVDDQLDEWRSREFLFVGNPLYIRDLSYPYILDAFGSIRQNHGAFGMGLQVQWLKNNPRLTKDVWRKIRRGIP